MDFTSSVQDISWLRNRYREGTLSIRPPYQRRPVWADKQKCSLIETILIGLPIPEVYIRQITTPDGDSLYEVVDGQQRIRTVLQFVGVENDEDEIENNNFVLDKLPQQSPYWNKKFAELPDEKKVQFFNYQFVVRYLKNSTETDVRDMFQRLNQFLTPLNNQELRNAIYNGPFARLCVRLADNEYWAENRIVTAAAIRRMVDVEFVSELLIGVMHGPQGGADAINDYYRLYEDYEDEFPGQRDAKRLFDRSLAIIQQVLPEIKDGRWGNKTDFYTLFVAVARLLRDGTMKRGSVSRLRNALNSFATEVNTRLGDENVIASQAAVDYVRAVARGANDKNRRATRHAALLSIIRPYFNGPEPRTMA